MEHMPSLQIHFLYNAFVVFAVVVIGIRYRLNAQWVMQFPHFGGRYPEATTHEP
jgi:hypothetical protein